MRILFIHEVNYRSKVVFEMHEFPELLARRGHEVSFLEFPEAAGRRSLRTRRETIRGRVHPDAYVTLITPPTLGGGILERYAAPITTIPTLRREIRSGDYDVVVNYAVPTTGWQATSIARRAGVPIVFRALDVSHAIRSTPVAGLIRRAERHVYRHSTVVSANNPAMAEYVTAVSGRTGRTVVSVPPVDLSHFAEAPALDAASLREQLGIPAEAPVIMYMGTFFHFSGLDTVMCGLVTEFETHPQLRLVLVGGGEQDQQLRSLTTELGIADRVVFTGVVPYAELPRYLQAADVAINPFEPQQLTHLALPHKVLQYMASGVPAVSTSLRGLRQTLGEDSGVTWVDVPQDVASAATELATASAARRSALAETSRAVVSRVFDRDAAVLAFEELLASVR